MFFIHKHEISQEYGGPEEGGWWYVRGTPVENWRSRSYFSEEIASIRCRQLNDKEFDRQNDQEDYSFTSVLSNRSTHYSYSVEEFWPPREFPESKPYYE